MGRFHSLWEIAFLFLWEARWQGLLKHGILQCLIWCEAGRICRAPFRALSSICREKLLQVSSKKKRGLLWKGLWAVKLQSQPSLTGCVDLGGVMGSAGASAPGSLPWNWTRGPPWSPVCGHICLIIYYIIRTSSFSSLRLILCYVPTPQHSAGTQCARQKYFGQADKLLSSDLGITSMH